MDQVKIGKFIKEKRKEKKITQSELAEKLNVTDRAISKWENGICMPDSGIIPELCEILNITINDLFSGETVDVKNKEKKLEENLLDMIKLKQEKDKQLLNLEIFIGISFTIIFLICVFISAFVDMKDIFRILLIVFGFIPFLLGCLYALRIEQIAGYYKCDKCDNKYVPTYKSVLFAAHVNRTRKMKCPKCGEKSWQRKILK